MDSGERAALMHLMARLGEARNKLIEAEERCRPAADAAPAEMAADAARVRELIQEAREDVFAIERTFLEDIAGYMKPMSRNPQRRRDYPLQFRYGYV
jgi:hypothetical protein